jgi:hypothetical protein
MSPIGRVFILLNLALAGTFIGFAGTFLQRQDNWHKKFQTRDAEAVTAAKQAEADKAALQDTINKDQVAMTSAGNKVATLTTENAQLADANKALEGRLSSLEGDLKQLTSNANATKTSIETAFAQLKEVSDKAIAAETAKDAAMREKDDAVAKHREATQKIAALEASGSQKDTQIADLTKDKGELGLLLDAARVKGFMDSMAVPALAGTVTHVAGRLVTVSVSDNPNKAEIKPGYKFAIYDGATYKGEARVTASDSDKSVAFCTLEIQKGEVKVGDKASTQTN